MPFLVVIPLLSGEILARRDMRGTVRASQPLRGERLLATFIAAWDGRTWSFDATPNTAKNQIVLNGVSCASSVSCKAVGGTVIESYG